MFTNMNIDFGFTKQPMSMFMPLNIEFGFATQPNSVFNVVNTEFGWRRPVRRGGPSSCRDTVACRRGTPQRTRATS